MIYFVVWLMMESRVEKSWTRVLNVSYEHLQICDFQFPPCPLMFENDNVLLLAINEAMEFVLYKIHWTQGFNCYFFFFFF